MITQKYLNLHVHNEGNRKRDLSGLSALLSNNYYYFGEEARPFLGNLRQIIKRNQGHRKIENVDLILEFEAWINQFEKNKIYADSQLRSQFDRQLTEEIISNSSLGVVYNTKCTQ